jgi:ubiquinone/menaquinone biosynthesis C-methylase UbiE
MATVTTIDRRLDPHVRQYSTSDYDRHVALASQGLFGSEQYSIGKYFNPARATLEIGTGAGRIAFALESPGGFTNVAAVDMVPRLIEAARAMAAARGSRIRFDVAEMAAVPFEDASFDQVVCVGVVLSHIIGRQARLAALREIGRVMRPGGMLILDAHNLEWGWHVRFMKLLMPILRLVGLDRPAQQQHDYPRVGEGERFDPWFFRSSKARLHYFRPHEFVFDVLTAGFHICEFNSCRLPKFGEAADVPPFATMSDLQVVAMKPRS